MSYQVTIEPLGQTIEVEEGQTILDAALRAGIYMPHACCHGLCATCKVQVVDGEVDHGAASPFALMDFERDEGRCLACCARADVRRDHRSRHRRGPGRAPSPGARHSARWPLARDLTPTIKGDLPRGSRGHARSRPASTSTCSSRRRDPRAFSLANPPQAARRARTQRAPVPDGKGTSYIHKELKVGDKVTLTGPLRPLLRAQVRCPAAVFMAGGRACRARAR